MEPTMRLRGSDHRPWKQRGRQDMRRRTGRQDTRRRAGREQIRKETVKVAQAAERAKPISPMKRPAPASRRASARPAKSGPLVQAAGPEPTEPGHILGRADDQQGRGADDQQGRGEADAEPGQESQRLAICCEWNLAWYRRRTSQLEQQTKMLQEQLKIAEHRLIAQDDLKDMASTYLMTGSPPCWEHFARQFRRLLRKIH